MATPISTCATATTAATSAAYGSIRWSITGRKYGSATSCWVDRKVRSGSPCHHERSMTFSVPARSHPAARNKRSGSTTRAALSTGSFQGRTERDGRAMADASVLDTIDSSRPPVR
jgi:hypothetical protein